MIIYLVRHGQSEANISNYYQGQLDTHLTQEGFEQAQKLAQRFKGINDFEIIYTSDSKRAYDTAKAIYRFYQDKEFIASTLIRERSHGEFHGKDKLKHKFEDLEEKDLFLRKPPQGENFYGHVKRVEEFLVPILENEQNCVIVSHGGTIRILLYIFKQLSKEDFFTNSSKSKNTSVYKFKITHDKVEMLLENCTKHLEEM
ncbi:MAG: histidine phosphatase family protein [Candidatus Woesearchaeota archaeon]